MYTVRVDGSTVYVGSDVHDVVHAYLLYTGRTYRTVEMVRDGLTVAREV